MEYKINKQKSVVFLRINNELSEREIRKTSALMYDCTKKNKKPSNKFNQGYKRPVLRKL